MAQISRISLVGVLTLSALFELVFNRIGAHLFGPTLPGQKRGTLFSLVDNVGLFFFYWTGILALIVCVWSVSAIARDKQSFDGWGRWAVAISAALFLPLAGLGILVRLPAHIAPHLTSTWAVVVLAVLVTALRRPAPLRCKLGVIYLAVPLLLYSYWLLTQRIPALTGLAGSLHVSTGMRVVAEQLAIIGAFAAFLFFTPRPRLAHTTRPAPLAVAGLTTAVAGFLIIYYYPLVAEASLHGFNLSLPPPRRSSLQLSLHLAACFFFCLAVTALLWRRGVHRATALGLLLIALSGFHLQLPAQLLLTLAGLIQLTRCGLYQQQVDEAAPLKVPDDNDWRAYLARVAESVRHEGEDSGEALVLRGERGRIARVCGTHHQLAYACRLLIHEDHLFEVEVDVGSPPKDSPAATLTRTRARRGARAGDSRGGPRVRNFSKDFCLRDSSGQIAELLSPSLPELDRSMHGWLGFWPGEGLRYRARPDEDGWPLPLREIADDAANASVEELKRLIKLLIHLARRAGE